VVSVSRVPNPTGTVKVVGCDTSCNGAVDSTSTPGSASSGQSMAVHQLMYMTLFNQSPCCRSPRESTFQVGHETMSDCRGSVTSRLRR
jgi:hypothetical protein